MKKRFKQMLFLHEAKERLMKSVWWGSVFDEAMLKSFQLLLSVQHNLNVLS